MGVTNKDNKKRALLNKKLNNGKHTIAPTEAIPTVFVIAKIKHHSINKGIISKGFKAAIIPNKVATPFPPLPFKNNE